MELTLGAGTVDDNITNITINIFDDIVVEGRESFNISGVVAMFTSSCCRHICCYHRRQ